jgi:hypothetical protein
MLKHEKGVDAPGVSVEDAVIQAIYNKDLRTYSIQCLAGVMHKVGNGYVDLVVTCYLSKIGMKYQDREGVYIVEV